MVSTLEKPSTPHRTPVLPTGKALIYLRVSRREQEDGASLDVQEEQSIRYCEAKGLEIIGILEESISGLIVDRAEYQKALQLARSKAFDTLVVFRYDRSGRDDVEYFGMLKDFSRLGVRLASASGESDDPFYQKIAGLLAWNESRTLSIRVTGSKMKRHTDGKWNGKPVFGYSIEKHPEGGVYLVTNEQSPLVTEMFQRYASGKYSLMDLRDFLNKNGVSKSRYSIWYILTNRVYLGYTPHGKNIKSQFHSTPDQVDWTEGKHHALVDEEVFDRVQVKLSENKSRQRGGPAAKYLFSGLVYCGNCGHKYQARTFKRRKSKTYIDYRCNRRHSFGDCLASSVLENRIRAEVIPTIKTLLCKLTQEDIRAAVKDELVRQQESTRSVAQRTRENLGDLKEKLEARLSRLEDSYLDGDLSRDRYLTRRDEIMAQLAEIKAQLAERPHLALPDLEQLFALADSMTIINGVLTIEEEPLSDQAWREFVESLVDKIIIEGHDINVIWKPEYAPLLKLVDEG